MDLIDLKEKIGKIRCILDRIRYKKGKHLYLAIFFIIFLMIVSFLFIFIFQKQQINTKENILKSYYSDTEKINSDASAGSNNADSSKAISSISSDNSDTDNANDTGNTGFGEKIVASVIKVYICGHIKTPGVYDIKNGFRLVDLVNLAGGATEDACLEAINLAQVLADSQKVYIPSQDEIKNGIPSFFSDWEDISSNFNNSSSTDTASSQPSQNKIININFAGLSELVQLPGIGNVIAQNIIDYRNKYGQFKNKEELKNVKGIGEKKFEKIKDFISV